MVARGKRTCRILKEIRRQIAEANDIELVTSECKFQGDCLGTCPKCEAEVLYLEEQLERRRMLGKAVLLAGISMNVLTSSAMTDVMPTAQYQKTDTTIVSNSTANASGKSSDDQETARAEDRLLGDVSEHHPTFPGLNKYLAENIRYPDTDKEGRVIVSFMVETDGSLTDITVRRGIAMELDEEAVRVVKSMPKWIPGERDGQKVRVRFTLPVVFKKEKAVEKPKTEAAQEVKEYDLVGDAPAQMPSFPGGYDALKKFIDENLRYPHPDFCGEGRVVVTFTVEKDGSLTDVCVVRSIAKELDEEAVRLVKSMPKWIPGQHFKGKPARMKYTLPISFKLK